MKNVGIFVISCVLVFSLVGAASALKFSTNDLAHGKSLTFDAIKGLGHHDGAIKGGGASYDPPAFNPKPENDDPQPPATSVPEPATMLLLGAGLLGLVGVGRKRFHK